MHGWCQVNWKRTSQNLWNVSHARANFPSLLVSYQVEGMCETSWVQEQLEKLGGKKMFNIANEFTKFY